MTTRSYLAELLGTALLVIFGAGAACTMFGMKVAGASNAAGVVVTAVAFGLVLMALVYIIGSVSGAHVNPAVTLGMWATGRIGTVDAVRYWIAQFVGGILGTLVLWAMVAGTKHYSRTKVGLGADGYGDLSITRINAVSAFIVEIVLTFLFVLAVLAITAHRANGAVAGLGIGLSLTVAHLLGIPFTGTSVNPARSFGPALIVGHQALSQVWLFIVAPLVGALLAAAAARWLVPVVEGEPEFEPAQ